MDLGKNAGPNYLRAWREFRRMTQEELASEVGTTGAVISLLEEGKRGLSAKWLRKLAPALHTTPGHLLDHDPTELPTDIFDIWAHIEERERPRALRALEIFRTGTEG
jgi:transcriptional regulator with XRE-family HTH domain